MGNSHTTHERLQVLISAYACEPERGSEPSVGWNFVTSMAKHHDVTVLTRSNNKRVIESNLSEKPINGLNFVYHDLPKWASFWKKGGRGVQLYYYLWQLTAIPVAKRLNREKLFNLCQHLTFVKYWAPSCLAWLNMPFIWGPVGGGDSTPINFLKSAGIKGIMYETTRVLMRLHALVDPFVRFTAKRCSICIPVTKKTEDCVRKLNKHISTEIVTQMGISKSELLKIDAIDSQNKEEDTIFLFVGNLLFLKGIHLGLRAFTQCKTNSQFWIIGEGPERNRLVKLAQQHNILEKVHFFGKLKRHEVWSLMKTADVIVHPSLHDSGGGVPIEAMACRKPIICLDLAGPATLVPDNAGIKIPAKNENLAIKDISNAMLTLANNDTLRQQMGEAGRVQLETLFIWDKKVKFFAELYSLIAKKENDLK